MTEPTDPLQREVTGPIRGIAWFSSTPIAAMGVLVILAAIVMAIV